MLELHDDINVVARTSAALLDEAEKHRFRFMIAQAAYYKAEKRGFASGHEWEDWFEAEKEIMFNR